MMKRILLMVAPLFITASIQAQCSATGIINFQRWNNINGSAVSNLTSNSRYPNSPSSTGTRTSFEMAQNLGSNLGVRMNGYLCAPTTGNYIFWISADNSAELWISTNTSTTSKVRRAYLTNSSNYRQWTRYSTQKSVAVALVAGQKYYIEALMKESSGSDHLSVGWSKPGQSTNAPSEVIPGTQLSTSANNDTQAPTAPTNLEAAFITTSSLVLKWSASSDNIGVTGYDVYRNGVKLNSTSLMGTSFSVTGLSTNTNYSMTVRAKDAAGNETSSSIFSVTTIPATAASESFSMRTVIANQRMPHDLVYAPDNNIWYTERFGGTVSKVNPVTGIKNILLTLGSKMARTGGQDGLMGLALHPKLLTGKPYVFIAYTYESTSATLRKIRIERYNYDSVNFTLTNPVTIQENIPGSNDHNSARLAIGPDNLLYFTIGDMGAGQFDNISRANNSQNPNILEGKILRFNTEAVAGSWIPGDNPFTNAGAPTAVYSIGHRNAQGLVWGNVNGVNRLYNSEHGPFSDDEINVIETGRNYGWPQVAGYCDGNYNGRTIGGFSVVNEQANCIALNAKEPLRSIYPSATPPSGGDNMLWPSMAPSGMDFYGSNAIPGWQHSLLVAMLKSGTITRYQLSNDGLNIISDTINYFRGMGRFRDVVVSSDGLKIYVACDSSGSTSGPTGGVTSTPANPGSILEFSFNSGALRQANELITKKAPVSEVKTDRTIDVYPNPASTYLVLYQYTNESGRRMELIDMNGRTVKQQLITGQATRMDVQSFPNGLYILKVTAANGKILRIEKVLISK